MRIEMLQLISSIKNHLAFLKPEDLSLSDAFKVRYYGETNRTMQVAIYNPHEKTWHEYEIRVTKKRR